MWICVSLMCGMLENARTWSQIPWNWSYKWPLATMWVLGLKLNLVEDWPVLLTAQPHLQLGILTFEHRLGWQHDV